MSISGLIALARMAWGFLTSKVGIGIMIALAVVAIIWWFGASRYAAGGKAGAARVQATIDAPQTGWSARLAQCEANGATKDAAIAAQNTSIEKAAQTSRDALAKATADLNAAKAASAGDKAKIAALMKPLVGVDTRARVLEVDQRLLGTLQ